MFRCSAWNIWNLRPIRTALHYIPILDTFRPHFGPRSYPTFPAFQLFSLFSLSTFLAFYFGHATPRLWSPVEHNVFRFFKQLRVFGETLCGTVPLEC